MKNITDNEHKTKANMDQSAKTENPTKNNRQEKVVL
jgi:hypothetical protein